MFSLKLFPFYILENKRPVRTYLELFNKEHKGINVKRRASQISENIIRNSIHFTRVVVACVSFFFTESSLSITIIIPYGKIIYVFMSCYLERTNYFMGWLKRNIELKKIT